MARDAFDGGIGPLTLLAQVQATVPWLVIPTLTSSESTNFTVLLAHAQQLAKAAVQPESRQSYFGLCLAAHHATVASYVPTDVDNRIRGQLWKRVTGMWLARRRQLVEAAWTWPVVEVSARTVTTPAHGVISGHAGEWLAVTCGWLAAALLANEAEPAAAARARIDEELHREANAYIAQEAVLRRHPNDDAAAHTLLHLAWILTHNVGDVDQGMSHWPEHPTLQPERLRFARLAHPEAGDPTRYDSAFVRAKAVYQVVAAEGHRNYPLREAKSLRQHRELLLPLGPCLEDWGSRLATSPHLPASERSVVVAALCAGIERVQGQIGYHRALHGFAAATANWSLLISRQSPSIRAILGRPDVRDHLRLTPERFRAGLAQRVRTAMATSG